MTKRLVVPETGEIIEDIAFVVTTKQQEEYRIKKEEEKKKREAELLLESYLNQERWIASYDDDVEDLNRKLNIELAGACLKLSLKMNMNSDGRLDSDGKPMTRKQIHRYLEVGESRGDYIIKELMCNKIQFLIFGEKNGRYNTYKINPKYHTIGKEIDEDVIFAKIYKKQTTELLKRVKLRHLGMLYMFLPYFHFQSLHLCTNPNKNLILNDKKSFFENYIEGTIAEITHFQIADLVELTGKTEKTIKKYLKELSDAGLILYNESRNTQIIKIRPDMFVRGKQSKIDTKYVSVVMADFREIDNKVIQEEREAKLENKTYDENQSMDLLTKLKELKKNNPLMNKTDIAKSLGISRQHLYRLLKKI